MTQAEADGFNILQSLEHRPLLLRPDRREIKLDTIPVSRAGAHQINQIIDYLSSLPLNELKRTKKGCISVAKDNLKLPAWDIVAEKNMGIEITVLLFSGMWRIQFRSIPKSDAGVQVLGSEAWRCFEKFAKAKGIDLMAFAVSNGYEIKAEIEPQIKQMTEEAAAGVTYTDVHHMDFNSAYVSGIAEAEPQIKPVIEDIYKARLLAKARKDAKANDYYKAVLTNITGYCQSKKSKYGPAWAHWAKAAHEYTNNKIRYYLKALRDAGRTPLLINTDGIWYQGEIFHDENEGIYLGQWKNDHVNCTFRIKSAGSYEFIEDGKYYPKQSGHTRLDDIKPRSSWVWGDIFNKSADRIIEYQYIPGSGIHDLEGNRL